jgi:hypothetical protein
LETVRDVDDADVAIQYRRTEVQGIEGQFPLGASLARTRFMSSRYDHQHARSGPST